MKHHGPSVLLLITVLLSFPVHAQTIQQRVSTLEDQVQALQNRVQRVIDEAKGYVKIINQLSAAVDSQSGLIGQLILHNQDLQAKLGCMSKTADDVYFTGCNVHIVSGSGTTAGAVNGLGNLIIGYNEPASPDDLKTGSHNLVVGYGLSYSSYAGVVVGYRNTIAAPYASVTGGSENIARGPHSSVTGGQLNTASGGKRASAVGG